MRNQFLKYIIASLIIVTSFMGCKKEYASIEEEDTAAIADYLQQNNLNNLMTQYGNTGIYYQIITPGTGADLKYSEIIPIVSTTKSIDNSYSSLDTFSVRQRYGVNGQFFGYFTPDSLRSVIMNKLKKRGGKIRVILPSRFAFGLLGKGDISGNASLDYTVNVLNDTEAGIAAYDEASIIKYLAANNLTGFTKTSTGLYFKIADAGTGTSITESSTITADYKGKFFNGEIFDQSETGKVFTIPLNDVIQGWKEGIPLIKQGGSIRLIIPSKLAYGNDGRVTNAGTIEIPPVSSLDFDIKVTAVTP